MLVQYGVLAYDRDEKGEIRFLLITSRDTGRWVVPRGNPMSGLSGRQSAAAEAYEEAGITGALGETEIGRYRYDKLRSDGTQVPAEVHLYPLEVACQSQDWPERHERKTRWFDRQGAAAAVDEADLKAVILAFDPPAALPRQP